MRFLVLLAVSALVACESPNTNLSETPSSMGDDMSVSGAGGGAGAEADATVAVDANEGPADMSRPDQGTGGAGGAGAEGGAGGAGGTGGAGAEGGAGGAGGAGGTAGAGAEGGAGGAGNAGGAGGAGGLDAGIAGDAQPECGPEICDGLDNDCDGLTDEAFVPIEIECGVGACAAQGFTACVDGAVVENCEPSEPSGDDADCNNTDEDCDGRTDEGFAVEATVCGVGACVAAGERRCDAGAIIDTCREGAAAAADLSCDSVDDDCDGRTDEDHVSEATRCGLGVCAAAGRTSCVAGVVQDSCMIGQATGNDADCNNTDEDCDGRTDEGFAVEATVCGVGACVAAGERRCDAGAIIDTCREGAAAAADLSCDGVDDDCDGRTDEDHVSEATRCGLGVCAAAGRTSCVAGVVQDSCMIGQATGNDADCNNTDEDCDGRTDEGFAVEATVCGVGACVAAGERRCDAGAIIDTCREGAGAAADLSCDGVDDDCDGRTDEDYVSEATRCGLGVCAAAGQTSCVAGAVQDSCVIGQATGNDGDCNDTDEDCDGRTDEGFAVEATACGVGACVAAGERRCDAGAIIDTCREGAGAAADLSCDGVDDDCDGRTDEDYVSEATRCGLGVCAAAGQTSCVAGAVQDNCRPGAQAGDDNVCNDIDEDCDGRIDEHAPFNCADCVRLDAEICDDRDNDCDGEIDENPDAEACEQEACNGGDAEPGIAQARWLNVGGTTIAQLRGLATFPDQPTDEAVLTRMEIRTNQADNYGARLRCFLVPSETNTYRFWIASDDNGELSFSATGLDEDLNAIATVPGWTAPQQWTKFAQQGSAAIELEADTVYLLEALMKEGGGGDNLAVAWSLPGGQPQVITDEHCYLEAPNLSGPSVCDLCEANQDCQHPTLQYCVDGGCALCEPETNAGCADGLECVDGECVVPQTCFNGELDEGETAVDCGGVCGLCADGAECVDPEACNSGHCDQGFCRHVIDYCRIDSPYDRTVIGRQNVSVNAVFGEAGLTTLTAGNDPDPRIRIQLGHGPDNSEPQGNADWSWRNMQARNRYNDGGGVDDGRDGYTGSFSAPNVVARYDFAVRVSGSSGLEWTYCDRGPEGSNDGYRMADAGQLTVRALAPTCDDRLRNQDETDVDCGGRVCGGCNEGQRCGAARDCIDRVCTGRICQAPSCEDFVRNGDETDTDCGGPECLGCFFGQRCSLDRDCRDGRCGADGLCAQPTCDDGIQNGQEAGVDCGGECVGCANGAACTRDSDCRSGFCDWRNNTCGDPWFERSCFDEEGGNWAMAHVVDAFGVIHMSRIRRLAGDLIYTRITADGRRTDVVVAEAISTLGGNEVDDTDITLFNGQPAIAFRNNAGRYEVATLVGAAFERTTVVDNASAGYHCEIGVLNGQLVTAFTQGRDLRFATRAANGQWQAQNVDAVFRSVGREAHMTFWQGEPVIAHRDFTLGQLRLSRRNGGNWSTVAILPQNGQFGFRPTVLITDTGLKLFHGTVPDEPDQSGDGSLWYHYGQFPNVEYQQFAIDNSGAGGGQAVGLLNETVALFSRRRQRSALFGAQDGLIFWNDVDAGRFVELEVAGQNDQRRRYGHLGYEQDPFGLPVLMYSDERTATADAPDVSRFCIYRAADQDGDAIPDPVEFDLGTDPENADTDGDGRTDGEEYLIDGTDPRR